MNASLNIARRLALLVAVSAAAILAGCAAPAQKESMAAAPVTTTKKLPYTVRVEARGGNPTGPMDTSNISNDDLQAALESSIAKSGLFTAAVKQGGDYQLTVSVTQLTKPMFGTAFTVTLETAWSLVKVSDKSVVMRKAITSSYTAEMSEAFIGATRLRLAVEGAVRNNIAQGFQAISELPL